MADKIRNATLEGGNMCTLLKYMMHGWLSTRADVIKEVQPYWSFTDEVLVIARIMMKG